MLLQWGRRLSTAEMSVGLPALQVDEVLQWGRRLSTAEIGERQGRGSLGRTCFNGAAVSQRRKFLHPVL